MKNQKSVRSLVFIGAFLLQLGVLGSRGHAAAGAVDLSFDPGSGINGAVHAIALLPGGKCLVGGSFSGGASLARINSDGTGDTSFNPGTEPVSIGAYSVALLPDGKMLVGRERLDRHHPDGSMDTNFNASIAFMDQYSVINAIAVQSDGKVLIGGNFYAVNGTNRNQIARLNQDGTLDSSFQPAVELDVAGVFAITAQADGKVVIGGYMTVAENGRNIVRLNADGSLDQGFSARTDANGGVSDIASQPDGRLLIGGSFTVVNGTNRTGVARLNADGSLDNTFAAPLSQGVAVFSIGLQSDGRVIIGGGFSDGSGVSQLKIARFNANGSPDDSFNPGAPAQGLVESILVQPDGRVLIGGTFQEVDGAYREGLARLNADGSLDASFHSGGVNDAVSFIAVQPNGQLLVTGAFTKVNGVNRNGIARLNADGSLDSVPFDRGIAGPFGPVTSVALQADGKVLIGTEHGMVRVHANGAGDDTFNAAVGGGGDYSSVTSIAVQADSAVLVGGYSVRSLYDPIEGSLSYYFRLFLSRLNADGSKDAGFEQALGDLFLGDRYFVRAMVVQPDGKVLVAGNFFSFKGTNRFGIARINPDGTLDAHFTPEPNHYISSVALQSDGKVLIGGAFTFVNGVSRRRVARLHSDGTLDTDFNPGTGADREISAIALEQEGKLLIVGSFTDFNGTNRNGIARLNANGSLDSSFDPGTGPASYTYVTAVALQADGKALIGGSFLSINGTVRPRVARLHGDFAPPSLSIAQSAAFLDISWPLGTLDFRLQENANPALPDAWSPVSQVPATNGSKVSVTLPATAERMFFRLKSQ